MIAIYCKDEDLDGELVGAEFSSRSARGQVTAHRPMCIVVAVATAVPPALR